MRTIWLVFHCKGSWASGFFFSLFSVVSASWKSSLWISRMQNPEWQIPRIACSVPGSVISRNQQIPFILAAASSAFLSFSLLSTPSPLNHNSLFPRLHLWHAHPSTLDNYVYFAQRHIYDIYSRGCTLKTSVFDLSHFYPSAVQDSIPIFGSLRSFYTTTYADKFFLPNPPVSNSCQNLSPKFLNYNSSLWTFPSITNTSTPRRGSPSSPSSN